MDEESTKSGPTQSAVGSSGLFVWLRSPAGIVLRKYRAHSVPRKGEYVHLAEKRHKVKRVDWWKNGQDDIADVYLSHRGKIDFTPWKTNAMLSGDSDNTITNHPLTKKQPSQHQPGESSGAAICSLPDWAEVDRKLDARQRISALERFIWDYEPAGVKPSKEFREGLIDVLKGLTLTSWVRSSNAESGREQQIVRPLTLDLGLTRWRVMCQVWDELATGSAPILGPFLAGWFARSMGASKSEELGQFRNSFQVGWREADQQIEILSREA